MVYPDAEAEEAPELGTVGGVEAEADQGLLDAPLLVAVRHARAGQRLGSLGALALGEAHDVDRRLALLEQPLDRLVNRRLPKLEVERHRPLLGVDVRHPTPGLRLELLTDRRHVPERRRHQQEAGVGQGEQWDLPGRAPRAVSVVVKLVHHGVGGRRLGALAQGHARQHLLRAADHVGVRIDAGVARQHPDLLGAEQVAELEELLADQSLGWSRVEGALALAHRLEVQRRRHERLARAGRRREDYVLPRP